MNCNISDPRTYEICQIQKFLNLNIAKQSFPFYALTYQDNSDFPNKKEETFQLMV